MELIGTNFDSSGHYTMELDGDVLVTTIGLTNGEVFRETLTPAATPFVYTEEEWYDYSANGHTSYFYMYGEQVIIVGNSYTMTLLPQ